MILISYLFLILVCISGVIGLFLSDDYVKKISALSVAYSSLIILLVIFIGNNSNGVRGDINLEKTITFFIVLLIIFSINLMIALGIIKNIGELSIDNNEILDD